MFLFNVANQLGQVHITQLYMNAQEATKNMAEEAETMTARETRARQRDGACDKSRVELP